LASLLLAAWSSARCSSLERIENKAVQVVRHHNEDQTVQDQDFQQDFQQVHALAVFQLAT
jgi:hypothetical protein